VEKSIDELITKTQNYWKNFNFSFSPIPEKQDSNIRHQLVIGVAVKDATTWSFVWNQIFSYLSAYDLLKIGRVSKEFKRLSNDSAIWKDLCYKRWNCTTNPTEESWQCIYRIYYNKENRSKIQNIFVVDGHIIDVKDTKKKKDRIL